MEEQLVRAARGPQTPAAYTSHFAQAGGKRPRTEGWKNADNYKTLCIDVIRARYPIRMARSISQRTRRALASHSNITEVPIDPYAMVGMNGKNFRTALVKVRGGRPRRTRAHL